MARISPLVLLPAAVFAVLGVVFYKGLGGDDQLPSALAGQPAPAVAAAALGTLPPVPPQAMTDGRPKLVNFFASWCAPCRVEHPALQAMAARGVAIYGINYKDQPAKAEAFLAELGNPYTGVSVDPQARTGLEWGVYGVPETFVLDGQGRIVTRFAGPLTERSIRDVIEPALAKAGSPG